MTKKSPSSAQSQQQQQQQQQRKSYSSSSTMIYRKLSQLLLLVVCATSLIACPYSKVEESFQLQAVHDIFYYGISPAIEAVIMKSKKDDDVDVNVDVDGKGVVSSDTGNDGGDQENQEDNVLPYDHLQYPGVVPRTFVGPFILTTICHFVRYIVLLATKMDMREYPLVVEFICRLILMMCNINAWYYLASSIDYKLLSTGRAGGTAATAGQQQLKRKAPPPPCSVLGNYILLITACQFHLPYYSSRLLPNTFATILALYAYSHWLRNQITKAAVLIVANMTIFRCDILLLLIPIGLVWIFGTAPPQQLTIVKAIRIDIITMLCSLILTVPLDSILWQYWVWPEGMVFYYNTVMNKSSDWGTSPWYWYWIVALPKALLLSIFLVPLSVLSVPEFLVQWETKQRQVKQKFVGSAGVKLFDTTWIPCGIVALGYVGLYSLLGHKEIRFLYPILPLYNLLAAVGITRVHDTVFNNDFQPEPYHPGKKDDDAVEGDNKSNEDKHQPLTRHHHLVIPKLIFGACVLALLLSLCCSMVFVAVSRWNYPGGNALAELTRIVVDNEEKENNHDEEVYVYIDVASAMTGVSKFGERAARQSSSAIKWKFDKAGYEAENEEFSSASSHYYTHALSEDKDVFSDNGDNKFRVLSVIQGNPRFDPKRAKIATTDAIYVLERKDANNSKIEL